MFIGRLVFGFLIDATTQVMTSLLDNAFIFTRVNIPKYLFLLFKNISFLFNFGLTLLVYPIGCLIVFNIVVGLILSVLFLFFRDMQYLWGYSLS